MPLRCAWLSEPGGQGMPEIKKIARKLSDNLLVILLVVAAALAVYSLFGDVVPREQRESVSGQ